MFINKSHNYSWGRKSPAYTPSITVQCALLLCMQLEQTKPKKQIWEKKKQLEIKTINRIPKWNAKKAEEQRKNKEENVVTHPLTYSRKRVGLKAASQERERVRERERERHWAYNQSCILCGLFVVLMPFFSFFTIYATNPRFFSLRYCLLLPCCSLCSSLSHIHTHAHEYTLTHIS